MGWWGGLPAGAVGRTGSVAVAMALCGEGLGGDMGQEEGRLYVEGGKSPRSLGCWPLFACG